MAEGKKSFLLYADQMVLINKLSDEQAGKFIKHIYRYVNDENPAPESDLVIDVIVDVVKAQLKRDLKDWEREKLQRSEAGKKGMKNRWENRKKTAKSITKDNTVINGITKITDNVNVNVTVNDNVFINIGSEKFLMKPSELAMTSEFLQRTETTLITSLSGVDTTTLWREFDKDYTCHDFADRNHFYNALKKTGEEILNPKTNGFKTNTTAPLSIGPLKRVQ